MKSAFVLRTAWCLAWTFVVFAARSTSFAETPWPVQWTLSASTRDRLPLHKGATVVAHLHVAIQSGWHLYALDQEPGGPTAMKISLPARQPLVIYGDIDAPASKTAVDPSFNVETRFYEDDATFAIQLKATTKLPSGFRKIYVDVLYQACNAMRCLPPTVSHLTSPVVR